MNEIDEKSYYQKYVGDCISCVSDSVFGVINSTANYVLYGTINKRIFYDFNINSIKNTFTFAGNEPKLYNYKIWNIVRETKGKIECHILMVNSSSISRKIWEQSGLELKYRDDEFIESTMKAYDTCTDDEKKIFAEGVKKIVALYHSENKYIHANFFSKILEEIEHFACAN